MKVDVNGDMDMDVAMDVNMDMDMDVDVDVNVDDDVDVDVDVDMAVDVDEGDYLSTYGRLYNGYTAVDERRLCPSAWSVPTDEDWMELEMALGMSESEANATGWRGTDQGIQMKTTYGWLDDENGTNVSGFSGLPGGAKATVGYFYDAGSSGNWWSSSNSDDANAWYRDLELTNPEQVYRASTNRNYGFSIRCIKDAE